MELNRLAVGVLRSQSAHGSTITMGAPGVDGGVVFSPALANQLVEPVAKVLHLTGAQDTPHSH